MVSYYDKILAGIAVSLVGGILLGTFTAVTLNTGILLGALAASGFVYHAMFENPPLPTSDPRVAATVIVWHAVVFVIALSVFLE
ncbi:MULTISPECIES: hypothetical protein [Natrialba]|uniref:Uncharacterized protein n=1 Tax=Natrialba swarupiae TaxID=2448032 RepID=A0A5D5AHH1_9EURY|nr:MULTISPECIES: hypothetical protein [Natrialba]MCW8172756.1 hypothetical protein [Natrialba swarupiae]MWV38280.1 hypothetical protein [Natrialba sp. INN-245]TYT61308.1 hypothetical protein FYC77_13925 [Natrialba swarupiae]